MSDPVQAQLVCPASNCSVLLEALSPAGVYGSSKPASVLHLLFLSEPQHILMVMDWQRKAETFSSLGCRQALCNGCVIPHKYF